MDLITRSTLVQRCVSVVAGGKTWVRPGSGDQARKAPTRVLSLRHPSPGLEAMPERRALHPAVNAGRADAAAYRAGRPAGLGRSFAF